MKSNFLDRVGAYVIDILIVSVIVSIICAGLPNKENSLKNDIQKLAEDFSTGEMSEEAYLKEYKNLIYKTHKANALENGVSTIATIAYFIVFQYLNKGQTLGKKLLKLKVVNKEDKKKPNIKQMIIRSAIALGILTNIINIVLLYTLNKNTYLTTYSIVSSIQSLFLIATIITIISKKNGQGLHDMIAKTAVIKESE